MLDTLEMFHQIYIEFKDIVSNGSYVKAMKENKRNLNLDFQDFLSDMTQRTV